MAKVHYRFDGCGYMGGEMVENLRDVTCRSCLNIALKNLRLRIEDYQEMIAMYEESLFDAEQLDAEGKRALACVQSPTRATAEAIKRKTYKPPTEDAAESGSR